VRTAAVTTPSLAALKAYLQGEAHLRSGQYAAALDSFRRAVAHDTTFALAYYRMSIAAEWDGRLEVELAASEQAVRYAGRLAEHDRRLLDAYRARRWGDAAEAERGYRAIVAEYPEDVEAWYQLGEVLFHGGASRGRSFTESRPAWERVLALEPTEHSALVHLIRVVARTGAAAELDSLITRTLPLVRPAERTELRALRAFSLGGRAEQDRIIDTLRHADDAVVWQSLWRTAVYTRNVVGAERIARVMTEPGRSAATRSEGHLALMHLLLAQGRWRAARDEGRRVHGPTPWAEKGAQIYFSALGLLPVDSVEGRTTLAALERWAPEDTAVPVRPLPPYQAYRARLRAYALGLAANRVGETAAARHHARTLASVRVGEAAAFARLGAAVVRADAALLENRPAEALAALEGTRAVMPVELGGAFGVEAFGGWLRAESLRALGRDEEALQWYSTRTDLFVSELSYRAPAHLRSAELYERAAPRTARPPSTPRSPSCGGTRIPNSGRSPSRRSGARTRGYGVGP
jgi:hypothetical protein